MGKVKVSEFETLLQSLPLWLKFIVYCSTPPSHAVRSTLNIMSGSYRTYDVFTDTPFSGNQLALFPDAEGFSEDLMQKIAKEFNLSETCFVKPLDGNVFFLS